MQTIEDRVKDLETRLLGEIRVTTTIGWVLWIFGTALVMLIEKVYFS